MNNFSSDCKRSRTKRECWIKSRIVDASHNMYKRLIATHRASVDWKQASSLVSFISHVRVTKDDLIVTLSTMRLTMEIGRLKPIKMVRHVQPQAELILQRLREEVNALKKELLLNDMFLRQEALMNISKTRVEQIGRDITNFLKSSISELTLFNVTQAQILVKIVKQLYKKFVFAVFNENLTIPNFYA